MEQAYGSSGIGYQNEDLIVWMRTAGLPPTLPPYPPTPLPHPTPLPPYPPTPPTPLPPFFLCLFLSLSIPRRVLTFLLLYNVTR